jgi:hypothetical protein
LFYPEKIRTQKQTPQLAMIYIQARKEREKSDAKDPNGNFMR